MASLLLRPLFRPALGLGLGLSITTLHLSQQRPIRLDSGSFLGPGTSTALSADSYRKNAKTPVVRDGGLNPRAIRQMSSGSVIGLCAGLVVSTFSKPLALLIGLMVVGVQVASSYGINLMPYNRLQRYITSVDLRSAVQDNVAFKVSFGTTFALAAFMQF